MLLSGVHSQAFTLLLIADVLVGYHSSDGWITAINLVFHHYGLPEKEEFTSIFVAIVPVSLDVTFKYWVFKCALLLLHPSLVGDALSVPCSLSPLYAVRPLGVAGSREKGES
jgi:hypothetical protein